MALSTICSDFAATKNKVSHCFPIYFPWSDGTGCHDLSFLNVELFSLSSRGFQFLLIFCHKDGGICIYEVIYISPSNLDSSLCFFHLKVLMTYSAYKLNKQGDNIQPWHPPSPSLNQSIVPCLVLTGASWPAYRFHRRQIRWSGIPISFRIFHSLLWSTQSKALA